MDTTPARPGKDSPLYPYARLLGRRWSDLEFEDQCAAREGCRRGLLALSADRRVVAQNSTSA